MSTVLICVLIMWLSVSTYSILIDNEDLPKFINWLILPGTIITFLFIPNQLITNNILNISHPIYSDGGISTLSIIISLSGGLLIAGTAAFIYRIVSPTIYKYKDNKKRRG